MILRLGLGLGLGRGPGLCLLGLCLLLGLGLVGLANKICEPPEFTHLGGKCITWSKGVLKFFNKKFAKKNILASVPIRVARLE